MSKGLGRTQRAVLELIGSDASGAWTIGDVCRHVYPGETISKKHRVAVLRALRRLLLPGTWSVTRLHVLPCEYCLYDPCDDESQTRTGRLNGGDYWINIGLTRARMAREWRDASDAERIDIKIARIMKFIPHVPIRDRASYFSEIEALKAKRTVPIEAAAAPTIAA